MKGGTFAARGEDLAFSLPEPKESWVGVDLGVSTFGGKSKKSKRKSKSHRCKPMRSKKRKSRRGKSLRRKSMRRR